MQIYNGTHATYDLIKSRKAPKEHQPSGPISKELIGDKTDFN